VAELPEGYKEIPEEDRKRAEVLFAQGDKVAATANFEYAIEMYLSGLKIDPDGRGAQDSSRDFDQAKSQRRQIPRHVRGDEAQESHKG
jgi:hypothetical protein